MITRFLHACLIIGFMAAAPAVYAIDTEPAFDDPALQQRYERIHRELRCLVCQNQTIADSNATLASDLRREVRELIAAGRTDDEIREFMIERYGDFVLYRPRMTATNFLLWGAPVILLAIGAIAVVRVVRRRSREVDIDTAGPEAGSS